MSQDPTIEACRHSLQDLLIRVMTEDLSLAVAKGRLFQGAGVIISTSPPVGAADKHFVRHEYAKAVSWVFFRLKETFGWYLDNLNKDEFYARMSVAADTYFATHEQYSERDVMRAIIIEAQSFLGSIERVDRPRDDRFGDLDEDET